MYYNFWTSSAVVFLIFMLCYCGKREFFDEPGEVKFDDNGERYIKYKGEINKVKKPLAQVDLGTKYTIEDVNKATQSIIQYFGEKYNVNISITKVISIKNSPGIMQLRLFLYDPIKNIITGYTIEVTLPISKKETSKVKSVTPFSEVESVSDSVQLNSYASLNLNEGKFT